MKAAIIINSNASQGKSLLKWEKIKPIILDILPFKAVINYTQSKSEVKQLIPHLLFEEKCTVFIGGGGDGTINYILNELIKITGNNLKDLVLGGIGLGSSNDFQKPFVKKINKIPIRLNFKKAALHDIGQLEYSCESGSKKRVHFLLNSNLGITADANHFFNAPNKTLAFLKRNSTSLSILYASIFTLLKYDATNISDKKHSKLELTNLDNLSIVKSPFLSGSFCYPELVKIDDGKFGVYYIHNMNKFQLLKTMFALTNCKFNNSNKKGKIISENIELLTNSSINIEADGEVYRGKDPRYTLSNSQIKIAGTGL
jgi:diacylglycerol kinase (ATP)